jgi:hypothetical protein
VKKKRLIFASVVYPTTFSESSALLLAESIREFAGSLSQSSIWYILLHYGKEHSRTVLERFRNIDVQLFPFDVNPEILRFPFAVDALAAEYAEKKTNGEVEILAWLGSNTIVLNEPGDFLLSPKTGLGYRPVHHTLIGSEYEKPLDLFWKLIYECCGVTEDQIFPMFGHIDGLKIRPYFNAGFLVLRPERKLLQMWRRTFLDVYQKPDLQAFYEKDERYAIFMHQAILTGIVLSSFPRDQMQELPPAYNYPLHLYSEDRVDRPKRMEDLIAVRHEGLVEPEWMSTVPMEIAMRKWLEERIK